MNRTFIGVLLLLLFCVVGIGFYRGWFTLSSRDTGSNQTDIKLTVDGDKAKEDVDKVKDKTTELVDQARDQVNK